MMTLHGAYYHFGTDSQPVTAETPKKDEEEPPQRATGGRGQLVGEAGASSSDDGRQFDGSLVSRR